MQHTCGQTELQKRVDTSLGFDDEKECGDHRDHVSHTLHSIKGNATPMELYTAYLGKVKGFVSELNGEVYLEHYNQLDDD